MKKEIAIDESIGEINDLLLDDPKNTDLMFNLAFFYLDKKDFTQTLFVLKRVLKHGTYRSGLLAKVFMKIINDHNNELLDNPRTLTFGHYIQFNTNLNVKDVEVDIDGKVESIKLSQGDCLILANPVNRYFRILLPEKADVMHTVLFSVIQNGIILKKYSVYGLPELTKAAAKMTSSDLE